MTEANFKVLVDRLPDILWSTGVLVAVVLSAVASFRNGRKIDVVSRKTDAAADVAATAAIAATEAVAASTATGTAIVEKLDANHSQFNGRVDQLLSEAKSAAHAAGVAEAQSRPPIDVHVTNRPTDPIPVAEAEPRRQSP